MTDRIFRLYHEDRMDIAISADGTRKMCTICFEFKLLSELYHDVNGSAWDLCFKCARTELNYTSTFEEGAP